jgi:hypothetical protein
VSSVLVEAMTDFVTGNGSETAKIEKVEIIWIVSIREESR